MERVDLIRNPDAAKCKLESAGRDASVASSEQREAEQVGLVSHSVASTMSHSSRGGPCTLGERHSRDSKVSWDQPILARPTGEELAKVNKQDCFLPELLGAARTDCGPELKSLLPPPVVCLKLLLELVLRKFRESLPWEAQVGFGIVGNPKVVI